MTDFDFLLAEYRKLWKNRPLVSDESAESVLKEAIIRELKDENAHPRVRKTPIEKYQMATKRISESELAEQSKVALISLHEELMVFTKQ
ncbi:hypothetical protein [Bacillus sp. S/N-304-OC-R1]|uniref:hypothetical protein n=1 Tax=Bacillus sp. S/N-304-OC-R1 TaxID=2758034 RepID=UPI001C8F059E|nr:hypothetical protein [Bacillus sp. S/N-304-OC-R1]MBY0124541.1 hypothetical protein [Bacillus sp. S/N-304-OC-R1]